MENWQTEIKRLDKMRLELGFNMNQVEKLTGVNRSRLKGFFEFTNIPSMKFYFDVKEVLENEFEVKFGDTEVHIEGGLLKGQVPKMENKPLPPKAKEAIPTCNCKMEDNLFKRDKNCKMKKQSHKF